MTKAKYKKEKKETKKKIKQEEIKILKQLKNKLAGVAHIKAKEAESVKDSEKKAKKLKSQVFLLNLLQTFIEFLEFTFGSIITIVILLLFFIALVFIIVWIALNGLLHIDMSLGNGDIFTGKKDEDCIQGSQALTQNNFELPGQLSGTLTDQQKNIAICFGIYNDILNGKYGDVSNIFYNSDYGSFLKEGDSKIGREGVLALLCGLMASENDFRFPGTTDILTIPCNQTKDGNDDAWLGLEADHGTFIGRYAYTHPPTKNDPYKSNEQLYETDFVSKYTAVYQYDSLKDTSGNNPDKSLNNFVPYGIATQMGVLGLKYREWNKSIQYMEDNTARIAQEFGISANIDKLTYLCKAFIPAIGYHGHSSEMNEPLLRFWCAMWAASSENDAERNFLNYELKGGYGEPAYRQAFLGGSDKYHLNSNLNGTIGNTYGVVLALDGKDITVPIIKYLYDYCDSKGILNSYQPVVAMLNKKSGAFQNTNWHYSLIGYMSASKALQDVGMAAPIVTGGSIDDCECYEGTTSASAIQSNVDLNNFLFIGDSFTVQLNSNLSSEMSKHIVMAAGGAYPDQYVKDSDGDGKIDFLTTSITVGTGKLKDTVGPLPDNVNGVVVLIGTNQVTRSDQVEDTKVLLQTLVDKYDVPIYVQKVFPKGYYKDPINYHRNNGNYQWNADDENAATDKFNQEISSFCSTNSELNFIDTTAGLVESGYLKYTGDGLHLYTTEKTSDGHTTFEVWYENIKNAISNGGNSSYLSTQVECIANETMGENHTIDYENGVNTLKNFLAIAMKPVGECMYSWGGGRDEYIYAKGVSPRWKEFYLEQLPKGSYNFKAHCPYPSPSASSNADGLDCSGFVGWCIVNNRETIGSKVYYTVGAASEGNYLSGKGFGQIVPARSAEFSYLPGDVYYNSGHTWICIGPSKHGGCVFVHASPDGVQINGFGGGEKTAYEYMSKYWPDFLIFAKNKCKADSSYQTSYDQFTWYILSEQDTSGKGLRDPEGFRSKTAEEILEYLFNPPTSSYSSVGTGNFINTKGQPQGIWNTKDGQKTTMDLINSMQVGQAWGGVSAGNMNQAFITRVKNFVPYMGDAVHAKDGNPTCANTDMAKRVLTETKFKVPYYHQGSTSEESWARLKSGTSYNSTSSSTFYIDGCHIYSFAYALSATQQRLINPPEALVIGWYGGFWSDGMGGDSNINNLKKNLNLNVKTMQDGKLLGKADVDSVLDKNGVVIVYLTKPFSSGNYHWVVITERVKDNGVDKYKIWTSTKISQVFQLYTFDELYNKRVGSNWIRMGVMP